MFIVQVCYNEKILDEQTQRMCPALSSLGAAALVSLRLALVTRSDFYLQVCDKLNINLLFENSYCLFAHYPNPFDPL